MSAAATVLWVAAVVLVAHVFAGLGPHLWLRRDRRGDPRKGLAIFVESIRWLGVPWGARTVAAGLRDAGYQGEFMFWSWHTWRRAMLVLPAILSRSLLERQARKLAEFIAASRREYPHRPIYLLGYSCGAFVAVRAMELLPEDAQVDAAVLIAGAFDSGRDLSVARGRVAGPMVVTSSVVDWLIVGLATLIFGTADRRHHLSIGMLGVRGKTRADVLEIRWRPRMILHGHWGDHFSAAARGFVARCVAPAMGIGT